MRTAFCCTVSIVMGCEGKSSGHSSQELRRKFGPFNQGLSTRSVGLMPRVPQSAGFTSVGTKRHWSTDERERISETLLATNIGCFLFADRNHWSTVVLSLQNVRDWKLRSCSVVTDLASRAAINAACNSSFGIVTHLDGEMRTLPRTKERDGGRLLYSARIYTTAHRQERDASPKTWRSNRLILSEGK